MPTPALYREHPGADWRECEIVGRRGSGKLVLREVGQFLRGVFLAEPDAVRVPVIGLDGVGLAQAGAA